ncbi:hypothetical protein M501DRAFT_1019240 [Patellaria atrata CBS 101060]|uniref:Uncharacterized protein n=1 Tax=Patellaria atrata CBS 101060 TaxID=1346257 RepID=A0A9P4VLX2_9PEZI|nr:hypothetical protein M501DRAFT_1019240 [Patellaria atrata CBS 101060]
MDLFKKAKRRFSMKDKDQDPDYSADEADEETHGTLSKEIDEAEKHGYDTGKPGGFLNKLIMYGNRKTEDEIRSGMASRGGDGTGVPAGAGTTTSALKGAEGTQGMRDGAAAGAASAPADGTSTTAAV